MRLPIEFAVQHHQKNHADWLREHYIPVDSIAVFMNFLREIMIKIKLICSTPLFLTSKKT